MATVSADEPIGRTHEGLNLTPKGSKPLPTPTPTAILLAYG